MKSAIGWASLWVGCGGGGSVDGSETSETDTELSGACGDVSSMDVTLTGKVVDGDGAGIEGADLWLEERNWSPGRVHGTARSSGGGAFELIAVDLPVVEGCWGTAVSYWLVGDDGARTGEKPLNPEMLHAWEDGTFAADITAFPLILR